MGISLEILCNFMGKMLEGELPDEELCQFFGSDGFHVVQQFWGGNDEAS